MCETHNIHIAKHSSLFIINSLKRCLNMMLAKTSTKMTYRHGLLQMGKVYAADTINPSSEVD